MRTAVDHLFREGRLLLWGVPATGVLVETLLDHGVDGDVVEAEAAIERLATAPADEGLVIRDIWLLRLRALLARARGDATAYAEFRDRYRDAGENALASRGISRGRRPCHDRNRLGVQVVWHRVERDGQVLQRMRYASQRDHSRRGVQAGDGVVRRCGAFDGHRGRRWCRSGCARSWPSWSTARAAVVQRYGGTVDKFTGDGIMAVFGAPVALEDHALRACLAALGIQDEVARLTAEVERCDGVGLQLRVGLNSGQVVAGEIGSGAWVTPPSASRSGWRSGWNRWRRPAP